MPPLQHDEAATEFVLSSIIEPLDLTRLFGRVAPVEVDLGCGDGTFLVALAAQNPNRNFLGIERMAGRISTVCRKVDATGLTNVRVIRIEAAYAVAHLLPESSIEVFHLLFPDPWPKHRHQPRRTITREFIRSIYQTLVEGGLFHFATDDADYFEHAKRLLGAEPLFGRGDAKLSLPQTTFERRFALRGVPIQRLLVRKTSPLR